MAFTVTKVSKRRGKNWILRDVSFNVEDGEIVGLFGAAGSGKTTLLELIAGKLKPEGGSVDAKDVRFPAAESNSGWSIFGSQKPVDRVGHLNAIANITAGNLLLDDPFAGLDRLSKDVYYARLRDSTQNVSILFATSDYDEVMAFADRVVVLDGGTVAQEGTPQVIYNEPATTKIAVLTGRCNLITARRLTSNKADLPEFVTIDGEHRLFAVKPDNNSLGAINRNLSLAIRPEQIPLSFGASFPEDNLLKATVTGHQFLGPQTIIDLDANGLILEAAVPRLVGLNIGDECMVGLPPDRLRILKD